MDLTRQIAGCTVRCHGPNAARFLDLMERGVAWSARRPKRIALYGENTPRPAPGPVTARRQAREIPAGPRQTKAEIDAAIAVRDARISELWAAGVTVAEIASRLSLSGCGVSKRARRLGLPPRRGAAPPPAPEAPVAAVSPPPAPEAAPAAAEGRSQRKSRARAGSQKSEARAARFRDRMLAGETPAEIAEAVGVSESAVWNRAKSLGLTDAWREARERRRAAVVSHEEPIGETQAALSSTGESRRGRPPAPPPSEPVLTPARGAVCCQGCPDASERIAELDAEVDRLLARIAELEALTGRPAITMEGVRQRFNAERAEVFRQALADAGGNQTKAADLLGMDRGGFGTFPAGRFDILVMDPPWKFASNSAAKPGRNARRHYPCMTDAEIAALPVAEWAAPDALLFLWTTAPMLRRSILIPEGWGFRYVSQLVWPKDRAGTGFWVRNRHEPVLLYRRGRFPCPKPAPFADSILDGRQREHSRKPDELQDRIDAVWPGARKVELFARQQRLGWTAWGSEVGRFEHA